ncbi:hypothetical protein FPQ18DRAFT_349959 [Pyronema domesticum]|nr:hypothetical protein FPQ18DRAFT_349959 [Pyronema domesticum]
MNRQGGWIGAPPPGVPSIPNRANSGLTFSQSVGGLTQPSTPLDMNSEFPALGGQSQQPSQAWNRLNTASPSQPRGIPPPPTSQQQQTASQQAQQAAQQLQAQYDNSQLAMEEFRAQRGEPSEDFPALPRTQPGSLAGIDERALAEAARMGQRLPPHLEGMMQQQQAQQQAQQQMQQPEGEKKRAAAMNGAPGLTNNPPSNLAMGQQQPPRPSPAPGLSLPSQLQQQQPLQKPPGVNGDGPGVPMGPSTTTTSEDERFGLAGLFSAMRNDFGDGTSLAKGQDLMMLGLDINQPEALWPTFASPFMELETGTVEPDFALPQCYTVLNTQPIHNKVHGFSDETLFYIFYTMPRDIMQEVVVSELAGRNWRYHMIHRLWMTKDPNGEVMQVSETAEKGMYVFFDPQSWERIRKEIILEYSHLDPRTTAGYPTAEQLVRQIGGQQ